MTYSPPAIAPHNPTTPLLSTITSPPLNSPTVHFDISNPTTRKPIAAGGSQDPPVPDANHPGETSNERGEGFSPIQFNEIDSTGGTTHRCGKARCLPHMKKTVNILSSLHLNNFIIYSTHISSASSICYIFMSSCDMYHINKSIVVSPCIGLT